MGNIKFDKLYKFSKSSKFDSFYVSIVIKTQFLGVSVTIEPHRYLQFVTTNCLFNYMLNVKY